MSLEFRAPLEDEFAAVLNTTEAAFGTVAKDEDVERQRKVMPLDRILAGWDGGRPIGVAAAYPFDLTLPGGAAVPAAGVTWVGVLPSHRRRGVLRELMRLQLDDVRRRGEPLAILRASESAIYGRFGYGIAAPSASMDAERAGFALRDDPGPQGAVRLVDEAEAGERFPAIYDRARTQRAGMLSRSDEWWRQFWLPDPEHWRNGAGPKFYALLELDGEPAGYALYRIVSKWERGMPQGEVRVVDATALSTAAIRELWRFLFAIDLTARIKWWWFDPPALFLTVVDPRRLHVTVGDGLWLRFVDLDAALRARSFPATEPVVLEVADTLLPDNAGRWRVGSSVERTDNEPDVALDVADLASPYLGAFTFEELAFAGRARELREGGLARATALFHTPLPPYCPEDF